MLCPQVNIASNWGMLRLCDIPAVTPLGQESSRKQGLYSDGSDWRNRLLPSPSMKKYGSFAIDRASPSNAVIGDSINIVNTSHGLKYISRKLQPFSDKFYQ